MSDATLPNPKPDDKELLQREVQYRLSYRGTLELDHICRAALPHLNQMSMDDLKALRDFLLHKEGDLMRWLVDKEAPPAAVAPLVAKLRDWFLTPR